jgi:hypothetical protein
MVPWLVAGRSCMRASEGFFRSDIHWYLTSRSAPLSLKPCRVHAHAVATSPTKAACAFSDQPRLQVALDAEEPLVRGGWTLARQTGGCWIRVSQSLVSGVLRICTGVC